MQRKTRWKQCLHVSAYPWRLPLLECYLTEMLGVYNRSWFSNWLLWSPWFCILYVQHSRLQSLQFCRFQLSVKRTIHGKVHVCKQHCVDRWTSDDKRSLAWSGLLISGCCEITCCLWAQSSSVVCCSCILRSVILRSWFQISLRY